VAQEIGKELVGVHDTGCHLKAGDVAIEHVVAAFDVAVEVHLAEEAEAVAFPEAGVGLRD